VESGSRSDPAAQALLVVRQSGLLAFDARGLPLR